MEEQVYVPNKSDKEILEIVKDLVKRGESLPKSSESDVILAPAIISAEKGEDAYEPINLSWDGVTIRRNPDFDVPLEQAKSS